MKESKTLYANGSWSWNAAFCKRGHEPKEKLAEQLEKSDAAFNENIVKVSFTMEVIGNVMQKCVGILENMAQLWNPYKDFQSFNHHNALLNLQDQGQ